MKDPFQILLSPHVTEKSMQGTSLNKYTFIVSLDSNKIEIREAIQEVFKVKVEKVNTLRVRGKLRRRGRTFGRTADFKKAVVTLEEGQHIDLFERA